MLTFLAIVAGSPDETGARVSLAAPQQERLRALFEANYDVVWRVLRRTGLGPAQADDGAQQVFLIALQRLKDVVDGKERAFLCSTAVLVGRRLRVGQSKEELHEEVPETDSGERVDDAVEKRKQRELLDRVLAQLDDELRAVLVLQDIEGLSKREAADALGLPQGTVASRLRRAREAFQELLRQELQRRSP